jgi:hypothetical protein
MATVVVKLAGNGIRTGMQDMRLWLDAKRIEPSAFIYQPAEAIAEVNFKTPKQAEAFARQFGGRLILNID